MKKTLKSIIVVVSLMLEGMVVVGCGNETSAETPVQEQESQTIVEQSTSDPNDNLGSRENNALLDSINTLYSSVDKLNSQIDEQKVEIENIQSDINELNKNSILPQIVLWGGMILALIIAILAWYKTKLVNERAGRHRQEIDELRRLLSESETRLSNAARNSSIYSPRNSTREYTDLSSRISRLELRLNNQNQTDLPQNKMSQQTNIAKAPSNEEHGYFGLPSKISETDAYFRRLDKSRDSESRFKAIVKSDVAKFSPLEDYLNDLKSSDTFKMALNFQGCALSDAKEMRLIESGEAKLDNKGRWVITRKAEIRLS